jgi:hypothetical protein
LSSGYARNLGKTRASTISPEHWGQQGGFDSSSFDISPLHASAWQLANSLRGVAKCHPCPKESGGFVRSRDRIVIPTEIPFAFCATPSAPRACRPSRGVRFVIPAYAALRAIG